jgi:hypothetical protein
MLSEARCCKRIAEATMWSREVLQGGGSGETLQDQRRTAAEARKAAGR